MEIIRKEWDSAFFNCEVFAVTLYPGEQIDLGNVRETLQKRGADVAYVFLEQPSPELKKQLVGMGAILYDEKVTYSRPGAIINDAYNENVIEYSGELRPDLLELVLSAGHDSRFKKDPRFSEYFESFYKVWIQNSLSGTMADKVFAYVAGDTIAGFVTCKINNGVGNIGLIATSSNYQRKGIGRQLVVAVDAFYVKNNVTLSTVITQATNEHACRFYEKMGFEESKKEYVYHWWFK